MSTRSLDLGCGDSPRNPFQCDEVYGIDIRKNVGKKIFEADLAVERIPFNANYFDAITAYDFIEHVPRIIYNPKRRFCFVELMNEIYRVLKMGGRFLSFTPALPAPEAWQDPTHVNIITEATFPLYFDNQNTWAKMYGFKGAFEIENQRWHENRVHLITEMKKVPTKDQ